MGNHAAVITLLAQSSTRCGGIFIRWHKGRTDDRHAAFSHLAPQRAAAAAFCQRAVDRQQQSRHEDVLRLARTEPAVEG